MMTAIATKDARMQDEGRSFDAWIVSDLHDRFGSLEPLPDMWLDLVDTAQSDD